MGERTCCADGCFGTFGNAADLGWCPEHFDYELVAAVFDANIVRQANGCLYWTGKIDMHGYGRILVEHDGAPWWESAHRIGWRLHHRRPIPLNAYVLHSCDHSPCADWSHLRLGTAVENIHDMIARGRRGRHRALNHRKVREIRRRLANGEHPVSIAPDYGIGPSAIRDIYYGRTWRHVP